MVKQKLLKWEDIFNRKTLVVFLTVVAAIYLIGIFIWGIVMDPDAYAVHYENKFIAPCLEHPFGTDFMGRDMFADRKSVV